MQGQFWTWVFQQGAAIVILVVSFFVFGWILYKIILPKFDEVQTKFEQSQQRQIDAIQTAFDKFISHCEREMQLQKKDLDEWKNNCLKERELKHDASGVAGHLGLFIETGVGHLRTAMQYVDKMPDREKGRIEQWFEIAPILTNQVRALNIKKS